MQFMDEIAQLATLHITRHPMAAHRLKLPVKADAQFTDPKTM